ncbi:MAG: COX15/CtaA family protein [Legionellaceae bacterium]|nr:COX15/CtaA family protein [Legionellaceae bacterium]
MNVLRTASTAAVILAFFVVMLGAFTRLTDAGLGCPDWPGCYGQFVLPSTHDALAKAQREYPHTPIESRKAWTEMGHRYAAGMLVVLIVVIACEVLRYRRQGLSLPWVLPVVLFVLIGFQAALGMWTVTLKLLPVVVMGHLLGGILIFTCLSYFRWQLSVVRGASMPVWRIWVTMGCVIVFCQIALGGWVSANYAGVACIGFPQCNGQWLPTRHLARSFHLFQSIGANYQGGLLDTESRVTIQMLHRLGAIVTATYVLFVSGLMLCRIHLTSIRIVALAAIIIVLMQFSLGVLNVVYLLPLWVAVAHNGVAALLLATMASLRYLVVKGAVYARCA